VKSSPRARGALVAAVCGVALTMSGCGSDDPSQSDATPSTGSSAPSAAAPSDTVEAAGQPFGAGCATLPAEGEGSVAGMADDPVVTAAANNPGLTQLVAAVQAANLVESLNDQQDITVLAPADSAFAAVPADALNGLVADTAQLTAVLTHHVIQGRLAPEQLAGTHTTLNNDRVTIESSGGGFTVPADQTVAGQQAANVICGNLPTANATVYLIDQVLTPPAA
jgi:uncharacterized surface protein with fasciclin (FAS1) repeats